MSRVLNAVVAQGASTGMASSGSAACFVHIWSASTSSCTVRIEQSVNNSNWYVCGTITNPSSAGELWNGPAAPYTRVNVSAWSSGTVSADIAFNRSDGAALSGGWKLISANDETFGAVTATSVTDSGLTAGRVVYAGSGGLLADEAAFAYNAGTNTLTADTVTATTVNGTTGAFTTVTGDFDGGSVTASTLTTTRVPYATTAGLLKDEAAFVYTEGTNTLTAGVFAGANQTTIATKAGDGAISAAPGTIYITKTSALGSSTLATPTTPAQDGVIMSFISTTAYAHVISVASGKVLGGSNTTITFTSGAAGDSITLEAIAGIWQPIGFWGTITIT